MSHPGMIDGLLARESRLRARGDFAGALQVLDEIISLDPDCEIAHVNKGAILLMFGRHREAIPVLERALVLAPENGISHNNLGLCYVKTARFEDGVREFRLALANGYRHEGVRYNLGGTLLNLGECQEGMDHYIAALRINPTYEPVLRDLEKLGRVFARISDARTIDDAEQIKKALAAAGNPTVL